LRVFHCSQRGKQLDPCELPALIREAKRRLDARRDTFAGREEKFYIPWPNRVDPRLSDRLITKPDARKSASEPGKI
jgi:hypothetical protein